MTTSPSRTFSVSSRASPRVERSQNSIRGFLHSTTSECRFGRNDKKIVISSLPFVTLSEFMGEGEICARKSSRLPSKNFLISTSPSFSLHSILSLQLPNYPSHLFLVSPCLSFSSTGGLSLVASSPALRTR